MDRRKFFGLTLGTAAVAAVPAAGALAVPVPEDEVRKYTLEFATAISVIEREISDRFKWEPIEVNDVEARVKFKEFVEERIKWFPAIVDSRVVCDESNNTPESIEREEFWADIYLKEEGRHFVQINLVGVRTGVAFNEVGGTFG